MKPTIEGTPMKPGSEEFERCTAELREAVQRHRVDGPRLRLEAQLATIEMKSALRSRDRHRANILALLAQLPTEKREAIIAEHGIDVAAWARDKLPRARQGPAPVPHPIPPGQCVYFIQAVHGGPIKIGMSESPERRLSDLQVGSPYKLRIIGIAAGGQPREASLHKRLAAHRLHGEWFTDTPEVLAAMAEVLQ